MMKKREWEGGKMETERGWKGDEVGEGDSEEEAGKKKEDGERDGENGGCAFKRRRGEGSQRRQAASGGETVRRGH